MSSNKFDTYILLAMVVAALSIATNIEQTIRFIDRVPNNGLSWLAVASGVFGQASLAFAMLSAVFVGRHVLGGRLLGSPTTDQIDTRAETRNETDEPPASFLSS